MIARVLPLQGGNDSQVTLGPQSNPITDNAFPREAPALPSDASFGANIIYLRSGGSDANNGSTPLLAKATLVAAVAACGTTGNWKVDAVETATFTGADATVGHRITRASTGNIYIVGNGGYNGNTVFNGPGGSTSTIAFNNGTASNIHFYNCKIGDGTNGRTNGVIQWVGTSSVNNLTLDTDVWVDAGSDATVAYCLYFNSPTAGTWRSATYVGDFAFRGVKWTTGPAGFLWRQGGTGTNPMRGMMICDSTGSVGAFAPNRVLFSDFWYQGNNITITGTGNSMALMVGTNTDGGTAFAGNNICWNVFIEDNDLVSPAGHALICGDHVDWIYCCNNRGGCTLGSSTTGQGFVFKYAYFAKIWDNTITSDCGSGAPNNTGGILAKASVGVSIRYNTIKVNNYVIGINWSDTSSATIRPSAGGEMIGNSIWAAGGSGAKCYNILDLGQAMPPIICQNDYRVTGGGVLLGPEGVRGLAPNGTTLTASRAAWAAQIVAIERTNDINSTLVLV